MSFKIKWSFVKTFICLLGLYRFIGIVAQNPAPVTIPLEGDYSGLMDDVEPDYNKSFVCEMADWDKEPNKWSTLKYFLRGNFTQNQRRRVLASVEILGKIVPCVKFEELDSMLTQADSHVLVQLSRTLCTTKYGRQPHVMAIVLSPHCLKNMRTILHLWFHLLGSNHEHNRIDRDNYIQVHQDSLTYDDFEYTFERHTNKQLSTYGLPYNPKSLMHGGTHDYSINGNKTISFKDNPNVAPDQPVIFGPITDSGVQWTDVQKIRKIYGCE